MSGADNNLNHEGHEVTRRKPLQMKSFVNLRVFRGELKWGQ